LTLEIKAYIYRLYRKEVIELRNELIRAFKQLTVCLETAIKCRDTEEVNFSRAKYRKLAKSLEKSLTALENAINIIGE
jgi:hypothetical protein